MSVIKQIFKSFVNGPVYLIFFGMIFFGIGAGLSYKQANLERDGVQVPGEVISLVTNCDSDGCAYAPIVRFKTRNEETITFESTYSSNPPAYKIGEQITVFYSLEAPDHAIIKGSGLVFRIIYMIVGGLIAAIGLGMFSTSVIRSFIKE